MAVKRINLLLLIIAMHVPSYVLSTTWYVHPDSGLNSIQCLSMRIIEEFLGVACDSREVIIQKPKR